MGFKCSIEFTHFGPKTHAKTNDFAGTFSKFSTFSRITFKTIDFVAFFFVGRVGRLGGFGIPKNRKIARESIILVPNWKVRF